jgi:ketopantoate reductase
VSWLDGVMKTARTISPQTTSCAPNAKRCDSTTIAGQPSVERKAPDHKPPPLQDYERGRPMEIDALVKAPAAFARAAGLSTPMLDMMAGLAIRRAQDKGLYPE